MSRGYLTVLLDILILCWTLSIVYLINLLQNLNVMGLIRIGSEIFNMSVHLCEKSYFAFNVHYIRTFLVQFLLNC
jgi:hypothetical protein